MKKLEIIFDISYLCIVIVVGIRLLNTGAVWNRLYGIMALVLGGGDACHLVPRIYFLWQNGIVKKSPFLGAGKFITSITMTVFYLMLYKIYFLYYGVKEDITFTGLLYILAGLRMILCLLPQNRWLTEDGEIRWKIYRNIPFIFIGFLVFYLFFALPLEQAGVFHYMWLAIFLSYACYLPVVLGAHKYPKLGMLMLPKTCAYIWMLLMALHVSN